MPCFPEPAVSLAFGNDARVTGAASCNNYVASYRVTSHALVIAPATSTRRACAPTIDAQEQAFLAALQGELTFELRDVASGTARALVLERSGGSRLVARRE